MIKREKREERDERRRRRGVVNQIRTLLLWKCGDQANILLSWGMQAQECPSFALVTAVGVGCFTMGLIAGGLGLTSSDFFFDWKMAQIDSEEGNKCDPFDGHEYNSFVASSDLDRNNHMNNARYVRELNFSRRSFFHSIGGRYTFCASSSTLWLWG
jgi:hypothetical protein